MNNDISNTKCPRILVISNNPFSDSTNNGKTLASFFDKYPVNNIAQLYFNDESPNNEHYINYFRITDNDIFKCMMSTRDKCGKILYKQIDSKKNNLQKNNHSLINKIKKYNLARIVREFFWISKNWKTELLNQWLKEFTPEIIFFCAGDSGFAYDITKYIQRIFNTKLALYITDDYVLPRRSISPFWWLRRNYVLKKMRDSVNRCDVFITISKQMRKEYKRLFGKNSIIAVNMSENLRDQSIFVKDKPVLTLVYTGSFHHKRYLTLNLLARSLKKYNKSENKIKVFLKVYSTQKPSGKIKKYLRIEGASEFCGKLNSEQLKCVLNSCDILVHVESFDRKSIESARLSISAKIPEYLSLGKSILAIGPNQVASMEYLKDSAFCITNKNDIYFSLRQIFSDDKLRKELSKKAFLKYKKNHDKKVVSRKFISSIIDVLKN